MILEFRDRNLLENWEWEVVKKLCDDNNVGDEIMKLNRFQKLMKIMILICTHFWLLFFFQSSNLYFVKPFVFRKCVEKLNFLVIVNDDDYQIY